MLDAFLIGARQLFLPTNIMVMLLGIGIGVMVGIIPVITGLVAMVLVLPFIYSLTPQVGLMIFLAIAGSAPMGGAITTILLNVPGTTTNIATLLDGYPMTQQGHGGRAIGASLTVKAMGAILAGFLAIAALPITVPLVMSFRSPELFMLILMGLTFMAMLGTGSKLKGIIAGFLGVVISFIGYQALTGANRFTFGSNFLYNGIDLVPFIIGLFAVPELIDLAAKRGSIVKENAGSVKISSDIFEGVKDVFRHFWLFIRTTILGWIIGVIPGIGASVGIFVAYGQAKQFSKNPEQFGKGSIEGVIAPECADSAVLPGALLTTLAFGIPGSAGMAIMLAALTLTGITPGPEFITDHLSLAFYLLTSVVLIAIVTSVILFFLTRWIVKVAYVDAVFLVPIILILVALGTFAINSEMMDVVLVIPVTALGYAMKKFDFSRAALILGFILGGLAERYFFLSLNAFGPLFFLSPISIAMLVIIILLLNVEPITYLIKRLRGVTSAKEQM